MQCILSDYRRRFASVLNKETRLCRTSPQAGGMQCSDLKRSALGSADLRLFNPFNRLRPGSGIAR